MSRPDRSTELLVYAATGVETSDGRISAVSTGDAPFIREHSPARCGAGDDGVMAYDYRVFLTRNPELRPLEPGAHYDPPAETWPGTGSTRSEVAVQNCVPSTWSRSYRIARRKVDGKSNGPLTESLGQHQLGPSRRRPGVGAQIRRHHLDHTRDFLHS
jgi:hypothetical protein